MPSRRTWQSDDRRDAIFDRTSTVFDLDDVGAIRGGHVSVLVLLASPGSSVDKAVMVDRVHSTDPRRDARLLVDMVHGGDGNDRDRARNLRTRLDLARRDLGTVDLKLAVYYGPKLPGRAAPSEPPTDAMMARVRHELEHEGGMGGFHWKSATTLDALPTGPHERVHFALIAVDQKGRVHDAIPRPNHHSLDRWQRRDLRALVAAVVGDPMFTSTITYCHEHGLTLLYCWRPEQRHRSAA